MAKIYACIIPVSMPKALMITGNKNGAMESSTETINPPLIIFPNNRTAKANVRESSLIILKGSMMKFGCRYDLRYPLNPPSAIPKTGTAMNTQMASAAVVEREAVGGSYQGTTVNRFDMAIKRNSVPIKPIYFSGLFNPTSFI